MKAADREVILSRCQKDLYFLCESLLNYQDMHAPLHRRVAAFMDFNTWDASEQIRVMLLPRAHLKSSMVLGKIIQEFLIDRNQKQILIHAVKSMAEDYASEIIQHLVSNEKLKAVGQKSFYEDPKREAPRWKTDAFDVRRTRKKANKVPSFSVAGIESEKTGFHYNRIFLDDLVTGENCNTQGRRDKVHKFILNCIPQLLPGGKILVIGTRWHPDDAYGRLIDAGVKSMVLGAYDEKGDPIFPLSKSGAAGHTRESLAARRNAQGMTEELFALQYLNDAMRSTEKRLKVEFIKRFKFLPPLESIIGPHEVWSAVDLCNTTASERADFAVVLTAARDVQGHLWVLDIDRGHFSGTHMVKIVAQHAERWKNIFVEAVGFQNQMEAWLKEDILRSGKGYPFRMVQRGGRNAVGKDERILSLAYLIEAEGLHVREGLEVFMSEIQAFRPGTQSKKDQLDCLEMIYAQTGRAKDPQKRVQLPVTPGVQQGMLDLWAMERAMNQEGWAVA
jgi:hypothetical protein